MITCVGTAIHAVAVNADGFRIGSVARSALAGRERPGAARAARPCLTLRAGIGYKNSSECAGRGRVHPAAGESAVGP